VLVFGELALDFGADAECGRVGRQALRELLLEILQLAKELVVGRVRHCRTVEDVVFVRGAGEDHPQFGGAAKLRLLGLPRRL
jgi:hypothetical protein